MRCVTRREGLAGLAACAATPALGRKRKQRALPDDPGPFEQIAASLLSHAPETAVYTGVPDALDGGPLATRLDDCSPDGEEALRTAWKAAQADLARIRVAGDSPLVAHRQVVGTILVNAVRSAAVP